MSLNHIDMLVTWGDAQETWRLTGVYNYPEGENKHLTWSLLWGLNDRRMKPWVCISDFNQILSVTEEKGRN